MLQGLDDPQPAQGEKRAEGVRLQPDGPLDAMVVGLPRHTIDALVPDHVERLLQVRVIRHAAPYERLRGLEADTLI